MRYWVQQRERGHDEWADWAGFIDLKEATENFEKNASDTKRSNFQWRLAERRDMDITPD